MPAILPFIPLIAAGVGAGGGIISSKIGSNASKNATKSMLSDPQRLAQTELMKHQTDVAKWGFGNAKDLLPSAKGAIDLPFSHYKAILSGDPNEFNKVLASSNSAIDRGYNSSRATAAEFSPHGAVAGQMAKLNTQAGQQKAGTYYDAYVKSLAGAGDSATQYSNLFSSLLSSGQNAGVPALQALSQIQGINAQYAMNQQNQSASALQGLGKGFAQVLMDLLNNKGSSGGSRGTTDPEENGEYGIGDF